PRLQQHDRPPDCQVTFAGGRRAGRIRHTSSVPWPMHPETTAELGRGVVVGPDGQPPEPWASSPRVVVGDTALFEPGPVAAELHRYWIDRRPVVVELGVDPALLRAPECWDGPVYELTPDFEFTRERMQFLIWANNYDARGGQAIWWHGRK